MNRGLHFIFLATFILLCETASPFDYIQASHSDLNISRVEKNGDVIQYVRLKNNIFNIYVPTRIISNNNSNSNNNNQMGNQTKSKRIGSKRELIYDCGILNINQVFVIDNCQRSINVDVCTGSCPKGRNNLYEYCRMVQSHSLKIEFNCPPMTKQNIYVMIKDADYCQCTNGKSIISGA